MSNIRSKRGASRQGKRDAVALAGFSAETGADAASPGAPPSVKVWHPERRRAPSRGARSLRRADMRVSLLSDMSVHYTDGIRPQIALGWHLQTVTVSVFRGAVGRGGGEQKNRTVLPKENGPDSCGRDASNYFVSVTMRLPSRTSKVSPVFTRPRMSVKSAGRPQASVTASVARSITTRTLKFFDTA